MRTVRLPSNVRVERPADAATIAPRALAKRMRTPLHYRSLSRSAPTIVRMHDASLPSPIESRLHRVQQADESLGLEIREVIAEPHVHGL